MFKAAEGLEPADVDPKQLRLTALIIFAIAVLGGIVIIWSYFKSRDEFRPAFIGEMQGHMKFLLANGEQVATQQIEEDIWLIYQTTLKDLEKFPARKAALDRLPNEGVRRLELYVDIDPNNEEQVALLQASVKEEANVWKIAAGDEVVYKFLKSNLKVGGVPRELENGDWFYDSKVILMKRDFPEGKDPRVHIRGEHFDFERAVIEATKVEKPEIAEKYVKEWFLELHIEYLLKEGDPTAESS